MKGEHMPLIVPVVILVGSLIGLWVHNRLTRP